MTRRSGVRRPVPSWSNPLQAIGLIARGYTFRTAAPIALVVGTILSLVNQGALMVDGGANGATWVRIGVNYLVPYVVSSIGYLAPFKEGRFERGRSVSSPGG